MLLGSRHQALPSEYSNLICSLSDQCQATSPVPGPFPHPLSFSPGAVTKLLTRSNLGGKGLFPLTVQEDTFHRGKGRWEAAAGHVQ